MAVLREHRKRQLEERLAWGPAYQGEHDLVFCREDGSPLWPQSVSRAFERHARQASLPLSDFTICGTVTRRLALAAGVHPKVVRSGSATPRRDHARHLLARHPGDAGGRGGEGGGAVGPMTRSLVRNPFANPPSTAFCRPRTLQIKELPSKQAFRKALLPDSNRVSE